MTTLYKPAKNFTSVAKKADMRDSKVSEVFQVSVPVNSSASFPIGVCISSISGKAFRQIRSLISHLVSNRTLGKLCAFLSVWHSLPAQLDIPNVDIPNIWHSSAFQVNYHSVQVLIVQKLTTRLRVAFPNSFNRNLIFQIVSDKLTFQLLSNETDISSDLSLKHSE
jgi:hypothetical protein